MDRKIRMITIWAAILAALFIVLVGGFVFRKTLYGWLAASETTRPAAPVIAAPPKSDAHTYVNVQYGFSVSLPDSWRGYSALPSTWQGMTNGPQGEEVAEQGLEISLRHPLWTEEKPRQDIPIMIFALSQWNALQQDKFHIGAAPIGPSELARNSRYVFALPARYNYAFPTGFEEVDQIIKSGALKAF